MTVLTELHLKNNMFQKLQIMYFQEISPGCLNVYNSEYISTKMTVL
jgi:hypothetical protein